jgi:AMP nucleosidase
MLIVPPYIAPVSLADADAVLQQVRLIYDSGVRHLRDALQRFVSGEDFPARVRAFYPVVRIHVVSAELADSPLSYGFVADPGSYETTLTRPDLFGDYYRLQFELLLRNHQVSIEVGTSSQAIPAHFALGARDHLEGSLGTARRQLMRERFDLPDLAAMDDGIANGTDKRAQGEALPLSLFTAPRVDYSLQRLRHYTGTAPQFFSQALL